MTYVERPNDDQNDVSRDAKMKLIIFAAVFGYAILVVNFAGVRTGCRTADFEYVFSQPFSKAWKQMVFGMHSFAPIIMYFAFVNAALFKQSSVGPWLPED